jgi:hypothetical protein
MSNCGGSKGLSNDFLVEGFDASDGKTGVFLGKPAE